jgi:type IV secretory pathway TraG/TraD family ATPase VirD4
MTLKIDLRQLQTRLGDTTAASILHPSIDKTALSVRASLANHLRVFEHLDETDRGLSLLDFMKKDSKTWLFLSCQTDQRAFLKPIFSVWLSLIIKGMMKRFENNGARTWIIIDELASLNKLPSLMTGLSEIRKYGGCFVLGFQDISQIEEIYGHSAAKTLSNLTGTKVLFRAVDTDMALRVSRYMGEQEKEIASESISFGAHQMRDGVNLSHQIRTKPVVSASQMMQLQNLEAYLKYPGSFPVSKITFSYLKCSLQNLAFIDKPPKAENEAEETKKQVITENSLEVTNMAELIPFNFKEKQSSDNQNDDKNKSGNSLEERELKLDKQAQNLNEKSEELLVEGEDKEILI